MKSMLKYMTTTYNQAKRLKEYNIQIGESIAVNFEDNTWTFEMPEEDYYAQAGKFAIVPISLLDELLTYLEQKR